MKNTFNVVAFLFVALAVSMVSCKKDDPNNNGSSADYSQFVGEYEISVITDSVGVDGVWMSGQEYALEHGSETLLRKGTMTISLNDKGGVHILAEVSFEEGGVIPFYSTDASLDDQGRLVIEPSAYQAPTGYVFNFTYKPSVYAEPLEFHSEMHAMVGYYDCGYIYTNVCVKK